MLSSELADLAGVTVRTLRHYHAIGLLPEPPRSSGDYRQYDVSHLVRLLRITRLAALGVPLSELPAVLDDPTAAERLLDELDRRAAAEIERLSARRDSIDLLRRTGVPAYLPPELSAWRSASESGAPADMVRYEDEQLILLAHLLGREGTADLAARLGRTGEAGRAAAEIEARFYALDAETPEPEVETLIEQWLELIRPVADTMKDVSFRAPRALALLEQLERRSLNPVQQRVMRTLQECLEDAEGR
ncbi:MerR family transcriptional regulator [Brachybacterium atlanticum]|uniref:MerR family transcriptional regulator n=1 Tax=Brachybacterium atlanticum TaxID=2911888 RepID=UPI0021E06BC5|nr:MerR family transcriptional regulator [Brachybacterium atlanticum]